VLGAAPAADADTGTLKAFAKAATRAGLALLLVAPGTKEPVDVRSSQQKRKDDALAQDAAKAEGRSDWAKVRSLAGAHLATTDPALIARYVDRYRAIYGETCAVNFAVECGKSNLVIVDADTAEQVAAFMTDCGAPAGIPPTVTTPGAQNEGGEWVHADGGHYYFTVPEGVTLPERTGTWVAPGQYVAMWRGRYALIPPSVRPEGAYQLTGSDYPLAGALLANILAHGERRAARSADPMDMDLAEGIDTWSAATSWDEILTPHGWTLSARPDNCGCDVWTAPGPHHSNKSATAHDTMCTLGRYTLANAPLHIWTHNPGPELEAWVHAHGGSTTLSKLQVVAAMEHEGDVGAAMEAHNLLVSGGSAIDAEMGVSMSNMDEGTKVSNLSDDLGMPPAPEPLPTVITEPGCPHGEISAIGRCTSCGEIVGECTHPVRDPSDNTRCGPCGAQVAVPVIDGLTEPDCYHLITDDTGCCLSCGARPADMEADLVDNGGPLPDQTAQLLNPAETEYTAPEPDPFAVPGQTYPVGEQPAVETTEAAPDLLDEILDHQSNGVPKIAPFRYWRDHVDPPEYAIAGLLEHRALSAVIGPPGVGKSAAVIDMACHLVTGKMWHGRKTMRQRVLYLPGEGMSGAVERVTAWEQAHGCDVGDDLLMADSIIQLAAETEDWRVLTQYIAQQRVGLIIFDTFARMSLGLDENSAQDVGRAVRRFDQIKEFTRAGVMLVHHTRKDSTSGRGSSALNGALDTEILITHGGWEREEGVAGKPLVLGTSKQKNAEMVEEMPLLLAPMHGSVVVTGPSGKIGDPFDTVTPQMVPTPEPVVETLIRIAQFLEDFPEQGDTTGGIAYGVRKDEYTATRRDPDKAWKLAVRRAIDLGLRYGTIDTLSGKNTGARYIKGGTSYNTTRTTAANDAITD
jgi:hypothetical protein